MKTDRSPTLISLFAGCGGSSCGYHMAGLDVRAAVEWDEEAARIYTDNFSDTTMLIRDVCEVTGAELLEAAGLEPGELDILDGSPPCQGFSTAGKRKMGDRRNRLFEEYVRLLREIRPRAFIMENVTGLRKGKMRLVFAEMTSALRASGYKVACRELNAWWYGVPQDRRRLIWIGLRDDVPGEPSHPQPTRKKPVTVAEALGDMVFAQAPPRVAVERRGGRRGEKRKFTSYFREGESPTLGAMKPPSIKVAANRYKRKPGESSTMREVPGALRAQIKIAGSFSFPCNAERDGRGLDRQSGTLAAIRPPTLTISSGLRPKDSGKCRLADNGVVVRPITVEEAKILQGFPAEFKIDIYWPIGNSVAPPMAKAVGNHVAALLRASAGRR